MQRITTAVRIGAVAVAMIIVPSVGAEEGKSPVTLASLLDEMTDRTVVARWPEREYRSLQASSYNRASVARDQPGWFADQDGLGFIRTETNNGRDEWVLMEHDGPGCITRMWTPYFYYGLDDRVGPNLRIYLDGNAQPVIDENMIALLTGRVDWAKPPLARETTRAGVFFLPVPFARSCRITTTAKPFYHIINYRAYSEHVSVRSFSRDQLADAAAAGERLEARTPEDKPAIQKQQTLAAGESFVLNLPAGPASVRRFRFRVPGAEPARLRSLVWTASFDGEQTVWCPLGDFFSAADRLHRFRMWSRAVDEDGWMTCQWVMPYARAGVVTVQNLGPSPADLEVAVTTGDWNWDDRSLLFHANWRYEEPQPTLPLRDWNFIEIEGQGVLVGDAWSILVPHSGWWGEGDEKIDVDLPPDAGFPTQFGTGTEDYYGWAGGLVPTPADEFSHPFAANIRVGGGAPQGRTRGYNICARERALDAIPFRQRLRFDIEASSLVRDPRVLQQYSGLVCWYARPGARHNRAPQAEDAARPLLTAEDLDRAAPAPPEPRRIPGAVELETLAPAGKTPGMQAAPQRPHESFGPEQWSGGRHLFMQPQNPGDYVEFKLIEKYKPQRLKLYFTKSFDFGIMKVSVNGRPVVERLDLYHKRPVVEMLDLGVHQPVDSAILVRFEFVGPNTQGRGARSFLGVDCIVSSDVERTD